ncbi:hypothetical protein BpHYR1_052451, partial [Brachionus plicatilis]
PSQASSSTPTTTATKEAVGVSLKRYLQKETSEVKTKKVRINNRNFGECLTEEECLKRFKEQEEAKNAKKGKKGTGRGRGRPRKLVESKLTPD